MNNKNGHSEKQHLKNQRTNLFDVWLYSKPSRNQYENIYGDYGKTLYKKPGQCVGRIINTIISIRAAYTQEIGVLNQYQKHSQDSK
jgi:hypothetical protein